MTKSIIVTKYSLIEENQRVVEITSDEVMELTKDVIGVDCGNMISYNTDDYVVIVFK